MFGNNTASDLHHIFRYIPRGDTSPESLASSCFFHRRLIQSSLTTQGSLPFLWLAPKLAWFYWLTALSDWPPTPWAWKLPLYNFLIHRHSSCAIHVAFLLSFTYLKTQLQIQFWIPQTNWPVKYQYITKVVSSRVSLAQLVFSFSMPDWSAAMLMFSIHWKEK